MAQVFRQMKSRLISAIHGRTERGATMVEYAVVAALIAGIAAAAVKVLGLAVQGLFNTLPGTF